MNFAKGQKLTDIFVFIFSYIFIYKIYIKIGLQN